MDTQRATVEGAERLLGRYFPVLDHGFVALVDYMGGDKAIADAARCSYGVGTKTVTDDRGLIRHLMWYRHTSPFEMTEVKLHCRMPIFVARQWVRHRTASLNEYSGRYSVMPLQFYEPPEDQMRSQSKKNKQGRAEQLEPAQIHVIQRMWEEVRKMAETAYSAGLHYDLARELARIDMPLSTYTEWYWKIDLHNLFHFLGLRCDSHAQWEIQQYANVIAGMVKVIAPEAYQAWIDYRLCSVNLSRNEVRALRREIVGLRIDPNFKHSPLSLKRKYELSKREIAEYMMKLAADPVVPDHTLDLSKSKDAKYFEDRMKQYVPEAQ